MLVIVVSISRPAVPPWPSHPPALSMPAPASCGVASKSMAATLRSYLERNYVDSQNQKEGLGRLRNLVGLSRATPYDFRRFSIENARHAILQRYPQSLTFWRSCFMYKKPPCIMPRESLFFYSYSYCSKSSSLSRCSIGASFLYS